jgi:hypothetical protein
MEQRRRVARIRGQFAGREPHAVGTHDVSESVDDAGRQLHQA